MSDKPNPANLLALAEQEYKEALAKIEAARKTKVDKLLTAVRKELESALGVALGIYNTIPEDTRKTVLSEPSYELVLNSLGLMVKTETAKKTRKTRTTKPKEGVTKEAVFAFIGHGKKTGELTEKFGSGVKTILEAAISAHELVTEKDKETGGKPATVYKKA